MDLDGSNRPIRVKKDYVGVNWEINPSHKLSSPQQLLMRFDTIISRLLSSVQSLELVERYEIHRKFHVGCGGVSSVQHDGFSLFSLLNDSLQSTSQLRKGIAVVHGCLAKVVLDCGICTIFEEEDSQRSISPRRTA